jgi:hypothetical protein
MHELLTYLNLQGVATILVLSQHGLSGEVPNDVDLSYLSDSLLQFRYFEARGQILKAMAVIKSRASAHASTIHQFRLGPGGLAAIVGDTDRRFTDLFRSILVPYADALVALIEADVAAGKLRSDLDADAAVSLIVGAYLGELVRRGTVDDDFADKCIHLMWIAMTAGQG